MAANNLIDLPGLRAHAESLAMQEWGPDALKPIGPHLTVLMPMQPSCDLHRQWHVVQTHPQQESKVAESLTEAHMDAYSPCEPKRIRVNANKHRTIMRPMLPGYVFAGFDVTFDHWDLIRDIRGVIRILMIKVRIGVKEQLRPVPIIDDVIERIRLKETERAGGRCCKHPPIMLALGTLVRILDPFAFAGLFGFIRKIDQRSHHIGVEIDIFGRKVPISIPPEQVEAI